jgi:hypothetical protein
VLAPLGITHLDMPAIPEEIGAPSKTPNAGKRQRQATGASAGVALTNKLARRAGLSSRTLRKRPAAAALFGPGQVFDLDNEFEAHPVRS